MKKYFIFLILVIPVISFASFNDANLTTYAIINVGSYNLNISGSTASVESITVNTTSFDVTLLSGSTFSISSLVNAGFNVSNTGANVTSTITCGNPSILTLTPSGTSTITITPVSSCTATSTSTGSHSSSGGYARPSSVATITPIITPTVSPTIITTPKPTYNFGTITLKKGSKGESVKELQRFLNDKLNLGLVIDGKLGPKTIAVIKQWQKDNGLVPDGLVGKLTKTKMLEK